AALDLAVREAHLPVGADVGDGVEVAVLVAHERDGEAPAVGVLEVEAHGLSGLEVAGVAGVLGAHRAAASMVLSSSASMASMRRSWTSGTPIWLMSSAKKPRTTRRRASASGMPRERR